MTEEKFTVYRVESRYLIPDEDPMPWMAVVPEPSDAKWAKWRECYELCDTSGYLDRKDATNVFRCKVNADKTFEEFRVVKIDVVRKVAVIAGVTE